MIQQTAKPTSLAIEALKKMLSKDKETPFSNALWDIIHDPQIPDEQPQESEISAREYREAKYIWDLVRDPSVTELDQFTALTLEKYQRANSIWERNKGQSRKNRKSRIRLSLDDFQAMLINLYGFEIINRSATHRLIHTANVSGIAKPAKSINREGLAVLSNFANRENYPDAEFPPEDYPTSFDVLLAIGEQTIQDVYGEGNNEEEDDSYDNIADVRSNLLLGHDGELTEDRPNNLRTLIHHFLAKNGDRDLHLDGQLAITLIDLLFKTNPKVDLAALLKIQAMLGIPAEAFLEMLRRDMEDMQQG